MKGFISFIVLIGVILSFYLISCQQNDMSVGQNSGSTDIIVVGNTQSNCVPIIAGQTITAGQICFEDVDTDNNGYDDMLMVTYTTTNGWELTEAHFHIADGLSGIPQTNKGNPIPGQFAYNSGIISGTTYTFNIPFSAINISCPGGPYSKTYSAHCVVKKLVNGTWQTETGWGQGTRFVSQGNWGMYNYFTLYCDNPPPNPPKSETAWAKDLNLSTCFLDPIFNDAPYFLNSERWGWSNGPYSQGTYTFQLWAAAGQCNTSVGTLVGTVTLNYSGSQATVTYSTTSGFTLKQVHIYLGNDRLYYKTQGQSGYTVAPGQFPIVQENLNTNTWSTTINNLNGQLYITAHAVVEGNY